MKDAAIIERLDSLTAAVQALDLCGFVPIAAQACTAYGASSLGRTPAWIGAFA